MVALDGAISFGTTDCRCTNYRPGTRSFFAVIDQWQLTARSMPQCDFIREQAEDERQAHLLEIGIKGQPGDDAYLPNPRWNGCLATFQRVLNRRDRHFQRIRPNCDEGQERDLEQCQNVTLPKETDAPRNGFGLIAQLRSPRRRGFSFVNSAGTSVSFPGYIHLSMRSGLPSASLISYHRSYFGAEKLFIEINIDYARMKFIYEQLIARPSASLGVDFHFDHLERVWWPDEDWMFYIQRNRATSIRGVTIQVNDGGWDRGIADAWTTRRLAGAGLG